MSVSPAARAALIASGPKPLVTATMVMRLGPVWVARVLRDVLSQLRECRAHVHRIDRRQGIRHAHVSDEFASYPLQRRQ